MLQMTRKDAVLLVVLNRPDVRNAFNAELVNKLTDAINHAHDSADIRVVVMRGEGKDFSAGADLKWMQSMKDKTLEHNVADAKALANLMHSLYTCRKPVVTVSCGAVMGGGIGLIACSDIAIAADTTFFALSETRLGLTPATISPFVVEAIGARNARRYMLTGERFDAHRAREIGLIHEVVMESQLQNLEDELVESLLLGGPMSQRKIKKLVRDVNEREVDKPLMDNLAHRIANQRISAEGQEGISAFLERRSPHWPIEED